MSNTSNTSNASISAVEKTTSQSSQQSGIVKPRGSLAKNVCKVLNLQKAVYQGYRVS
jgi:hypothetical protein